MSNPLVDLLKKAVGLPTAKNGSCCTPPQPNTTQPPGSETPKQEPG